MPSKPLAETAGEIKSTLSEMHKNLSSASASIENRLIAPGMTPEETATAKDALLYQSLLLKTIKEMIFTQCQMFDLCVLAHGENAEAVRFYSRMKWMLSPKSLFWFIFAGAGTIIVYLYNAGVLPKS